MAAEEGRLTLLWGYGSWQVIHTHWTLLIGLGLLITENGGHEVGMQTRQENHKGLEIVMGKLCNQYMFYKTIKLSKNK